MIFITGIIQALGMPKEVDWMEKHSRMGNNPISNDNPK